MHDTPSMRRLLRGCHLLETALGGPLAVQRAGWTAPQIINHALRGRQSGLARVALRAASAAPEVEGGAAFLPVCSTSLPASLRELSDRPFGIWVAGDLGAALHGPRVAIIGSRRPRPSVLGVTDAIAKACGRSGITVVSGLALGVDGRAHRGVLQAGGATIAVLGGGFRHVYPPQHEDLAQQIQASGGLLVSEYHPDVEPRPYRFAHRNRIIAALADVVIVVQAAERSGSIITAERALELGIPVAVVPGALDDPAFAGSMALIRDGAEVLVDPSGLSRLLQRAMVTEPDHRLHAILTQPREFDEIALLMDEDATALALELLDLELKGLIVRNELGQYCNAR